MGSIPTGDGAPIAVQTITNTDTADVVATVAHVQVCAEAGADIVRVSTPDEASTRALWEIVRENPVPSVADIHFHYRRAIEATEAGASCLRVNPGNIGGPERIREVAAAASDLGCSIRVDANTGILEMRLLKKYAEPCPEAMIESCMDHIRLLEDNGFQDYKIKAKASDIFLAAAAYRGIAEAKAAQIGLDGQQGARRVGGTALADACPAAAPPLAGLTWHLAYLFPRYSEMIPCIRSSGM